MKTKLPPGYSIREISDSEEFQKLVFSHARKMFDEKSLFYSPADVYSKKELSNFKRLREEFNSKHHYRLNLAVFYKDQIAGWCWGFQETPTVYYMCNSAVLERHRNKGLYSCLLNETIKRVSEKGFQKIYSRHVMTNNDILIPKLKSGFKITHFELSDRFGAMVYLTYYPQKIMNDLMDFRAGRKRPDKKLRKIFKL